jgi:hypothetical protein
MGMTQFDAPVSIKTIEAAQNIVGLAGAFEIYPGRICAFAAGPESADRPKPGIRR